MAYVPSYSFDDISIKPTVELEADLKNLKQQEAGRCRRFIDPTKRSRYDLAASYIEPISRELARREGLL